jgi:uncharacterized protein YndB with AHSA1/START domain
MAEVKVEDEVVVEAPVGAVWSAIKDPAAHAAWHPFVTRISGEHRLGATRTCTVLVGKQAGETKERCVEDDEGRKIIWTIDDDSTGFSRMVSEWQAGFELERRDGGTVVKARSTFRPKRILVRLLGPVVRRKFHQAQQQILVALKRSVERGNER